MSSGARVSAFAKRRKLDDGFVLSGTSSPEPVSSQVKNGVSKQVNANIRNSERVSRKTVIDSDPQTCAITANEHNSFDPLVTANVVNFSGSREVEKVNDTTLKIRLSKGQKCILQGIAHLWIREGFILLQGATLSESTNVYTILGSTADELPEIVAHSNIAEFQLESIPCHDPIFPSILNVPGKLGRISQTLPASFELLETDQPYRQTFSNEWASKLYEHIQGLFSQPPKPAQTAASTEIKNARNGRTTYPRVLIAGKRSTTTSKISIVTINRLLTGHLSQHNVRHVAFLDLDHLSPAFACPGTVSLATLEIPIFGPSFTSPLLPQLDVPNRLICSYFLGFSEQSALSAYSVSLFKKLLAKVPKDVPLVIRIGSNVGDLQHQQLLEFATSMTVSTCIYTAASKSSALYDAIETVADHLHSTLIQLKPPPSVPATSALEAHKLAIRSQFCLQSFTNGLPQWSSLPILTNTTNKLRLSFDDTSTRLDFVVIQGGVLRRKDISEALKGSLVALVTKEIDTTLTSSSHQQDSDYNVMFSQLEIQIQGLDNIWNSLEYVGLALVESVTDTMDSITLITNIDENQLHRRSEAGHRLGIVLERPGIDDKFTSQVLRG